MKNAAKTQYSLIQKGGLREELWEWADIEEVCRAGRLSPESMIFIPEKDEWKRVIDTELAVFFGSGKADGGDSSREKGYGGEYETLVQQIESTPGDTNLYLSAAELALAMGDKDAARGHFQDALERSPYHPRVVGEAKRSLPPVMRKTLRFFERPPHAWEDPLKIALYPFSLGPLYVVLPAAVITVLSWTVWSAVPCALALCLWAVGAIRASSRGEPTPPIWRNLFSDPLRAVARPTALLAIAGVELCLPFVVVAGLLLVTGVSDQPNVFLVIWKNPVLAVFLLTASLSYLPAVFMLAAAPVARFRDVVNPRHIASVIRLMEREYVGSVFVLGLLSFVMWSIGGLMDPIPFAARVFYAAAAVYVLLTSGYILGRLYARFAEQLDRSSDAQ